MRRQPTSKQQATLLAVVFALASSLAVAGCGEGVATPEATADLGPQGTSATDAQPPAPDGARPDGAIGADASAGLDSDVYPAPNPDGAPTPDTGASTDTGPGPTTGKQKDVWDQIIPAGFVTSADVGLPAGWQPKQTVSGNHSTTKHGQLIEDLLIEGTLTVKHDDVVVRHCRIRGGKFSAIQVTGKRARIEDNQIGLDPHQALLTKAAQAGGGDTIEVGTSIPLGATVYLSASTPHQEQYIVVASSGQGPHVLKLERRETGADLRSPAKFAVTHPAGDTIAWYHPQTDGPLPGNGISGTGLDYTVRRNLIQAVNDGLKHADGLTVDNLIRLQFFIPPAHLDGIQMMQGVGGRVLHNTIIMSHDVNAVLQSGQNFGPITGMQWKWNLQVGGRYFCVRWYGSKADFHWNRWLQNGAKPLLASGQGMSTRDLRYADGTLIPINNFAAGPDAAGDGSGTGDGWGNGYAQDPLWMNHFALPQNPEYTP